MGTTKMGTIWAMSSKDLLLLFRDRMGFFFAFFFPLAVAIFFGAIFSGGGGPGTGSKIDMVVVDEDQTDGSRAFVATLRGASELNAIVQDKEGHAFDRAAAADSVRRGSTTAFVAIPQGFGKTRESMFFGGGSSIVLGVDPSRSAERGMLQGILTKYGFMQMQEGFSDPGIMRKQVRASMDKLRTSGDTPEATRRVLDRFFGDLDTFLVDLPATEKAGKPKGETAEAGGEATESDAGEGSSGPGGFQPLTIKNAEIIRPKASGPSNSYAFTFPQGIIWGVMGCALGFGMSLVQERTRGTLMRLRAAPISGAQVLAGKALACFLATVGVSVMLILISLAPPFNVRPASFPLLLMAVVATALCFVGIMMLLAVFGGGSERGGQGLGWGVLLLLSMIGGGMIPLFAMPGWMRSVSVFSPIRWAILALERGMWREATLVEELIPCAVLVGIGAAGFAVGAWRLRKAGV